MVTVCAPSHALAAIAGPIPREEFGRHIQLVVTDNQPDSEKTQQGVASERKWLVNDLGAKHDLLRGGLCWGHRPRHLVAEHIAMRHSSNYPLPCPRHGAEPIARAIATHVGRIEVETVDVAMPDRFAALRTRPWDGMLDMLPVNAGVTNNPAVTGREGVTVDLRVALWVATVGYSRTRSKGWG